MVSEVGSSQKFLILLTRRIATGDELSQFQDLMEMMRKIQEDTSQNKEELMTGMRNNLEVLKVEINSKMENLLEDKIRMQSKELAKVCEQRIYIYMMVRVCGKNTSPNSIL